MRGAWGHPCACGAEAGAAQPAAAAGTRPRWEHGARGLTRIPSADPPPCPRYAHPLDLLPLVDINLGKVVHIECYDKPAKCASPRAVLSATPRGAPGRWRLARAHALGAHGPSPPPPPLCPAPAMRALQDAPHAGQLPCRSGCGHHRRRLARGPAAHQHHAARGAVLQHHRQPGERTPEAPRPAWAPMRPSRWLPHAACEPRTGTRPSALPHQAPPRAALLVPPARRCGGRSGACAWASTLARAWCSMTSHGRMATRCGPSCTARALSRWPSPTATPSERGGGGRGAAVRAHPLACELPGACVGEAMAAPAGTPCAARDASPSLPPPSRAQPAIRPKMCV